MVDMRWNRVSQAIQIWMLIISYHNILINWLFEWKNLNDYNNTNWFRHSLVLAAYITQTNFIFANNYMIVNCCNIFSNAHLLFPQKLKHLSINVGYTIWHLFQPLVSYCNKKTNYQIRLDCFFVKMQRHRNMTHTVFQSSSKICYDDVVKNCIVRWCVSML